MQSYDQFQAVLRIRIRPDRHHFGGCGSVSNSIKCKAKLHFLQNSYYNYLLFYWKLWHLWRCRERWNNFNWHCGEWKSPNFLFSNMGSGLASKQKVGSGSKRCRSATQISEARVQSRWWILNRLKNLRRKGKSSRKNIKTKTSVLLKTASNI